MPKAKPKPPPDPPPPAKADPTAVTPAQAAELLSREGGVPILAAQIEADLDKGAPRNPSGLTLNLILYAGWLLKQEE